MTLVLVLLWWCSVRYRAVLEGDGKLKESVLI
jgi:hypothetical protein